MMLKTLNFVQDLEYKSAYKKAYSDASNVWQKMAANYEVTPRSGVYDGIADIKNFTAFKGYFKTLKDCGFSGNSNAECWDFSGGSFSTLSIPKITPSQSYAAFIDIEGRQWIKNHAAYHYGEIIYVDTNGFKQPNKFGKDRFPLFPSLATCKNNSNFDDRCRGAGTPEIIKPYYKDMALGADCNVDNCHYQSWLFD